MKVVVRVLWGFMSGKPENLVGFSYRMVIRFGVLVQNVFMGSDQAL